MKALTTLVLSLIFSVAVFAADAMTVKVEGMMCGSCEKKVEKACLSVPGVKSAKADAATGEVKVVTDGKVKVSKEDLAKALEKTEYHVKN